MKGVGRLRDNRFQLHRHRNTITILVAAVVVVAMAAVAVAPAAASLSSSEETASAQVDSIGQAELESVGQDAPVLVDYEGNVTIPDAADQLADYGIVPTDHQMEVEDGRVWVTITAQDLGDTEDITGFDFNVRWDPYTLELEEISPAGFGAIRATNDHFQINTGAPGFADVEWKPSSFDLIIDSLAPYIEDVDEDEILPEMNDDELMTLEFTPTPFAEEGDIGEVWVEPEDTTIWHSTFDFWGSGQYDNSNVYYGTSEVEIVPPSVEPAVDDAVGSFELVADSGGYTDFGLDNDPGQSGAMAQFEAGNIRVEGDFNESGFWRSDFIRFGTVEDVGDDDVDAEIQIEGGDEGFEGYIDLEEGTMNMTTNMGVHVPFLDSGFSFDVEMTTGESLGLAGDADWDATMDNPVDDDAYIEFVSNEFIIPEEEANDVHDRIYNEANLCCAQSPGKNWVTMPFDMTIEEFSGEASHIDGAVEDTDGEPIENAIINVTTDETAIAVTDSTGQFDLPELEPGAHEFTVEAQGHETYQDSVELEDRETYQEVFTLEPGSSDFEVELEVSQDQLFEGDELVAVVNVENVGDGVDTQDITISAGGSEIHSETVTLGPEYETDELDDEDIYPTAAETSASFTVDEIGELTVEAETDDDSESIDVTVQDEDDVSIDYILEGTSVEDGFIATNEPTLDEAIEEGIALPPNGDEVEQGETIQIDGDVIGDTWQSNRVDFPLLNVDGLYGTVSSELGLSGTYDPENDKMTIEGTLDVTVYDAPDGDELGSFPLEIDATTGSSGALEGEADLDETGGTVVAVDNEFLIDEQSGSDTIDDSVGLPATDEGTNWIQLNVEIDATPVDGELERGNLAGVVTDQAGEPIEDASVELDGSSVDTDEDGSYSIENVDAGTYDLTVDATGYKESTVTVDIEADETAEQDVELELGDPAFEIGIFTGDVRTDEVLEVTGTVENTGDGPGSLDVTITVGDEEHAETLEVDVGQTEQATLLWDVDEDDIGQYVAEVSADGQTESETVEVEEALVPGGDDDDIGIVAQFSAETTDGFISFDEDNLDDAIEEGLPLPTEGSEELEYTDDPIVIEGHIFEGGVWQSTNIEFPNLNTEEDGSGLDASVDVPDGMQGTIDMETGEMTAESTFEITVLVDGGDNPQFSFDIAPHTGTSGALSGDANVEGSPPTVTLVDNEFLATEETGNPVIDPVLGLPITEQGLNWVEMELTLDIEEIEGDLETGTVEGVVESDDGELIEGATVESDLSDATTGADGSYDLSVQTGEQDLTVSADGYVSETVTVDVTEDSTTTQDVTLSTGEAEFEIGLDSGGDGTVHGVVENTGDAGGETTVELEAGGETHEETITVEPGESQTIELAVDDEDETEATLAAGGETTSETLALDEDESDSDGADRGSGVEPDFQAVSTGGFVATAEESREDAIENGVELPPIQATDDNDLDEDIDGAVINATVDREAGTWESTDVFFPSVPADAGLWADVSTPDGLSGEIDFEDNYLTVNGELLIQIQDAEFSVHLEATTGESGALTGEAEISEDGDGHARVVDNQFVITEGSGDPVIDSALDLPADEPGENWFELEIDLSADAEGVDEETSQEAGGIGGDPGFLSAFGQLIGMIAIVGGLILAIVGVATRFISAVDPDPGA